MRKSDISESEFNSLVTKYGTPVEKTFAADFLDFECDLIRKSVEKGRYHDITCFIQDGLGYVVIQKHAYAKTGIYRAPSGGAHPGETVEDAAVREMHEETGLTIRLLRFILDLHLDVKCAGEVIPWRSLVFLAERVAGDMGPVDTFEIYDVTHMTKDELLGEVQNLMVHSGWGGFAYRAFLTQSFFDAIEQ